MPNPFPDILDMALSAAPFLLLGLVVAGLIRPFIPEAVMRRWLGGRGFGAVARGAVIGAPLPLCSCGAIPTALALHRGGAGRGPTASFLISTPGIGVDSVLLTYALLGPFMVVGRVLGALVTAMATGLLLATAGRESVGGEAEAEGRNQPADEDDSGGACCASSACGSGCGGDEPAADTDASAPVGARLRGGLRYAFTDLLDDISLWIAIGLVVAGAILAFAPPELVASHGDGLLVMVLMAVVGIPMYMCATAATPIGAGLLLAGVSPGAVLVFLLAAPVTSLATLGVLRREMGGRALALYLAAIAVTTVALGLLADGVVAAAGLDVAAGVGAVREWVPAMVEWTALVVLVVLALPFARRRLHGLVTRQSSEEPG